MKIYIISLKLMLSVLLREGFRLIHDQFNSNIWYTRNCHAWRSVPGEGSKTNFRVCKVNFEKLPIWIVFHSRDTLLGMTLTYDKFDIHVCSLFVSDLKPECRTQKGERKKKKKGPWLCIDTFIVETAGNHSSVNCRLYDSVFGFCRLRR